jgi:DNA-binding NarL/FixJ family response regulator
MGKRILIVDDHATFRTTARMLLESEGFEVVGEAEDGDSALRQTTALSPDVILLDVQLPDIDGFEVANQVTNAQDAPAVILISSRDGGEFGPLVEACGARGFVAKADLSGERLRALLDG